MPEFKHEGIVFYYEDAGEGMPFVFQHGLGGDCQQTLDVYPPGPEQRVISMDFRAHGRTRPMGDPDRMDFVTFGDDVVALLDHLNISSAVIGGISLGAAVALSLAVRHRTRVKGLVLSRPAFLYTPFPEHLQVFAYVGALIRKFGPEQGRQIFTKFEGFTLMEREYPAAAQSLLDQFEKEAAQERAIRLESFPKQVPVENREQLQSLEIPTLILGCQQDPIHPFAYAQQLKHDIPGSELEEVPSKSIDPEAHVEACRRYIDGFLDTQFPKN